MYLRAKLTATVTRSTLEYEGSLSLCPDLIKELGILEYEQCIVNGLESRNDITYIIEGRKGEVGINGNLSTKHKEGDRIHILIFRDIHTAHPYTLEI